MAYITLVQIIVIGYFIMAGVFQIIIGYVHSGQVLCSVALI
jgi:hypothetical protein